MLGRSLQMDQSMVSSLLLASAIVGVLVGGQQLWSKVVNPRRRATKLKRLFTLIEEWFNEIDTRLEHGMDLPKLYSLEGRVERYIKDHQLADYRLHFTPKFRSRFLRFCGIRKEFHHDRALFQRYARISTDSIDLLSYWMLLVGAFSQFHRNYTIGSTETNFADVEMRIKVLRMYLRTRET
jgi:hypothetical protein